MKESFRKLGLSVEKQKQKLAYCKKEPSPLIKDSDPSLRIKDRLDFFLTGVVRNPPGVDVCRN